MFGCDWVLIHPYVVSNLPINWNKLFLSYNFYSKIQCEVTLGIIFSIILFIRLIVLFICFDDNIYNIIYLINNFL